MYFRNSILTSKPISQQIIAIQTRWPRFVVSQAGRGLKAVGYLRPTARSDQYKVQISYLFETSPEVIVLEPEMIPNFNNEMPEHLYRGGKLCLYRPIYGEFKFGDLISETIIPWTALWLYHYEVWHLIGDWLGGGEHPE